MPTLERAYTQEQSDERVYTRELLNTMIGHSCRTKVPKKYKNRKVDIDKVKLLIEGYTVEKLLIEARGGIKCTLCDEQLKMNDRKIVEINTAQCIKIIQHIYYGIGCTLDRVLGNSNWKVYAQRNPALNQSGVEIHCYPTGYLRMDPSAQVITFLQRQYENEIRDWSPMSAGEYGGGVWIASKKHFLFYREATFQGATSWDNVGYVCYKCGVMIKPDMMKAIIRTRNLRHIGAYLHLLSPVCHSIEQTLVNNDVAVTLSDYERMLDSNLALLPIVGQTIEDLFEWNFHRYSFPSSLSETLKGELKKIFVDQFNSYNENERTKILSNIGDGQFNEDMTALLYQAKIEEAVPEIYKKVDIQRHKFSCGFDCNNKPDIAFLPCGHIVYCTTCWSKNLNMLKRKGCPKPMCAEPKITKYMAVGNNNNYDLNGSEIKEEDFKMESCCICSKTFFLQGIIYRHLKYNSDFEELCNDDIGATFDFLSIGEEHKLSEAAGGAEQSETIDKKDAQEEEELIHDICFDCASTALKEKGTSGMFWEGVCPVCQYENPHAFEKFTYMKIRIS